MLATVIVCHVFFLLSLSTPVLVTGNWYLFVGQTRVYLVSRKHVVASICPRIIRGLFFYNTFWN